MKKIIILGSILIISLLSCKKDNKQSEKEYVSLDNITGDRPYSPAVAVGNTLYVSGQIAVDPASGKMIEGGVEDQTFQVLTNMKRIVEQAGFSMSDIVKCNVLLDTISYYAPMNNVYKTFFPDNPPARKAYAVESLPLGALVEIDAIAVK